MPAGVPIRMGARIPSVLVAEFSHGEVVPHWTDTLFLGTRVLVIGVPGAFTPVCSNKHLPPIIKRADELRRAGFSDLFCLVASDPFATAAWAEQLDPSCQLRFFSDGNLEFTRACGLITVEPTLFLGQRSRRYTMVLENAIVARLNVEPSLVNISCSSAEALLDA